MPAKASASCPRPGVPKLCCPSSHRDDTHDMGFLYGAAGGALGVCLQFYANGVRRMPLMYQPWLHAAWFGAGVYMGNKLEVFEEENKADLDRKLMELNRPPRSAAGAPPRELL